MANTWVEVRSDGTFRGTRVLLVIEGDDGSEVRYAIPGVLDAQWSLDEKPNKRSTLQLRLEGVRLDAKARIDTRTMSVEDLLSEIAAGRLARSKDDDSSKFITGKRVEMTFDGLTGVTFTDEDLP